MLAQTNKGFDGSIKALDRMTRSAVSHTCQCDIAGALLVIGQLCVMCGAAAIAFVALVVGCNWANEPKERFAYSVEANPRNFPPPQAGGRTWIFHASPSFDVSDPGKLREYVTDALKEIDLPPVTSDGKPAEGAWRQWSEGLGEYQFVWSIFDWNDYSEGPFEVRTGALARDRKKNRVIFVSVNSKK